MRYTILKLSNDHYICIVGKEHEMNPQTYGFPNKQGLMSWLELFLP